MKKRNNIIAVLALLLGGINFLFSGEKIGDVTKVGAEAYMFVREFTTVDQNIAFQRNFNVMQNDARAIDALKAKIESEKDDSEKNKLKKQLETLEGNYATNNDTMRRAYSFSTDRTYKLVFLKSNICISLTKEELSSLRTADGADIDPMKIVDRNGASLSIVKTVTGVAENDELQRMITAVMRYRMDMEKFREELAGTTDPDAQLKISEKLSRGEKALKEADETLRKKYNIKEKLNYLIETAHSKLYLRLTPEELAQVEAQQKK